MNPAFPRSTPTPTTPSFDHVRGLDGLRAVAVLIVLVAHFGFYTTVPGGFGVTVFFFISGLLITRLLLAETLQTGTLSLRNFYIRRGLRLYPTLLLGVLVGSITIVWAGGQVKPAEISAALFYVANYYNIYVKFGAESQLPAHVQMHPLGVYWSLAVEEQYYLVFPLLAYLLRRSVKGLWLLVLSLLLLVLLWRLALFDPQLPTSRIYEATDTRVDSILYGAFLAITLALPRGRAVLAWLEKPWVLALSLLVLLLCFYLRDEAFRQTYRYSLQGLALMPIVGTLCFSDRYRLFSWVLEWRILRLIGAWSYALYVFHPSAIVVAESLTGIGYLAGYRAFTPTWYAIAIGLTLLLSLGCYYLVERPLLGLRRRYGSHQRTAV